VSVGEVSAARALVAELHSQLPDFRVVVSSTTDTGLDAGNRLFGPDHVVFRWPLDFTFSVKAALDRLAPSLVILMEGDVWPNFLRRCRRRGVPVVIVNGRLGPRKGYPRYRMVRPLAASLFNSLSAIGAQHQAYADLYRRLGVRSEKVTVTGMMKYDSAELADRVAGQEELAAALGIGPADKVLVAGGTGAGEEKIVLDAFSRLLGAAPPEGVRLVIVPRRPERFEAVARLIAGEGFHVVRRSLHPDGPPVQAAAESVRAAIPACPSAGSSRTVILGDTMGELRKFYGLAYAVFIGRSLVPEGGSDMIEAAALAKPVAFGPHTFNFPQAETMVQAGCARRVSDAVELAEALRQWLGDPARAAEAGKQAQEFVRAQRGAARRNVELICRLLGRAPALAPGGIATDAVTG
jgi:3-deoxy-D-manno-octulosonic-acid transferase